MISSAVPVYGRCVSPAQYGAAEGPVRSTEGTSPMTPHEKAADKRMVEANAAAWTTHIAAETAAKELARTHPDVARMLGGVSDASLQMRKQIGAARQALRDGAH